MSVKIYTFLLVLNGEYRILSSAFCVDYCRKIGIELELEEEKKCSLKCIIRAKIEQNDEEGQN